VRVITSPCFLTIVPVLFPQIHSQTLQRQVCKIKETDSAVLLCTFIIHTFTAIRNAFCHDS
jgi:hypothetical protein